MLLENIKIQGRRKFLKGGVAIGHNVRGLSLYSQPPLIVILKTKVISDWRNNIFGYY